MNIFAEVTIDETGIIKQIDAVKEAADRFEDEALKLRACNKVSKINDLPYLRNKLSDKSFCIPGGKFRHKMSFPL